MLIGTVPAGLMTLLGGVVAVFTTRGLRKANLARDWPAADGMVTASYTDASADSEGTTMYRPVIQYTYTIGGHTYTKDTIAFGAPVSTSWPSPADRLVATYPQDRACRVFYNPDDPADACLRPGAVWYHYLFAVTGYVVTAIGTWQLLR